MKLVEKSALNAISGGMSEANPSLPLVSDPSPPPPLAQPNPVEPRRPIEFALLGDASIEL